MEYRKVGRGGAGNFYTRQDVEGAQKRAAQVGRLSALLCQHTAFHMSTDHDD